LLYSILSLFAVVCLHNINSNNNTIAGINDMSNTLTNVVIKYPI